jgi:hypothetical protein
MEQDDNSVPPASAGCRYDAVAKALEFEIDRIFTDGDAADDQVVEADRQLRLVDMNFPAKAVDTQSETRLQKHERRA